ncbi:hypothetical protein CCP4SC76_4660004 [Gammaproteobacteria bacterium]
MGNRAVVKQKNSPDCLAPMLTSGLVTGYHRILQPHRFNWKLSAMLTIMSPLDKTSDMGTCPTRPRRF